MKMKPSNADWMILKLAMVKKNNELLGVMDNYLDDSCDDLLRKLRHDVECCHDPKSFYEKEIPYRMEFSATADMRHITNLMSQGFANNLAWLQSSLRSFGITRFELPFSNYSMSSDGHQQNTLDLLDIHKARLYTRAGTIVTALCLSGFGAALLVGSILVATGADELVLCTAKRSKEKILAQLPSIVSRYKTQMRLHVAEAMSKPCSTIINTLNNYNYEQLKLQ